MWKRLLFRRVPQSPAGFPEPGIPRPPKQAEADSPFADLMAKLDRIPYPLPHKAALSR